MQLHRECAGLAVVPGGGRGAGAVVFNEEEMTIQPLSELAGLMGLGGLGQTGIPPGNQCYDATHDPGEIHCSNATDVIFSAIPLIGGGAATTDCSTSETACLAANPSGNPGYLLRDFGSELYNPRDADGAGVSGAGDF